MQSRILSGQLKPGDRLPPERELAEELGISRGSVNQGILDLERMGFLRVVPRKGTFVADYIKNATPLTIAAIMNYDSTMYDAELFRGFMDFRILVERECVRLACLHMDDSSRRMLDELTERIYAAEGEELTEALYRFHYSVTRLSGNPAYTIVFQSFELVLRNMIEAHYSDRRELEKCLPLYGRLADAMRNGNGAKSDEYLLRILTMASDYLGYMLRREN
jgi:DNA-binding FadR family transcriptional regulator